MKISRNKLRNLIVENTILSEGLRYHIKNSIPLNENIYRPGSERFFSLICEARKWYNEGVLSLFEEDLDYINSDMGEWGNYLGREVALDFPISQESDDLMSLSDKGYYVSEAILTKVFNNEFGNEIEIEVRDSNHDDFLDDEEPYDGVYIRMTGPNSETGNVMTRMEAQNLLLLLQNYFEEDLIESKKKNNSGSFYKGKKVKLNKPKRGGFKKFYVYVKNPKTGKIKKISFGAKGMSTGLRDPDRRKSFKARHNCEDKNDKTKPGYWACRIGRYPKVTGAPYTTWW